jgi:hypothetical protein
MQKGFFAKQPGWVFELWKINLKMEIFGIHLLISDGILGFFFVILIELMVFGSCGTQM